MQRNHTHIYMQFGCIISHSEFHLRFFKSMIIGLHLAGVHTQVLHYHGYWCTHLVALDCPLPALFLSSYRCGLRLQGSAAAAGHISSLRDKVRLHREDQ